MKSELINVKTAQETDCVAKKCWHVKMSNFFFGLKTSWLMIYDVRFQFDKMKELKEIAVTLLDKELQPFSSFLKPSLTELAPQLSFTGSMAIFANGIVFL